MIEVSKMDYRFTALLILMLTMLALFGGPTHSAETQSNVSGSNTSIEGGYTGGATTYESGSTSTTTAVTTSNSNIKSAHKKTEIISAVYRIVSTTGAL
jgi:hypothetical protein